MQIKTRRDTSIHPLEWLTCKTQILPIVGENVEQLERSFIRCWVCEMVQLLWKTIWQFLIK